MKNLFRLLIFPVLLLIFFVQSLLGCTNFVMDTPNGPIFGCNLDLFIPADGLVFINQRGVAKKGFPGGTQNLSAKWISTYGSVTFNLAGKEWAFGGMNEAGLVLGSMELITSTYPPIDERPPLTQGMWAQYVLDTCGDINDVMSVKEHVRLEDPAPPIHFLISDSTGNAIVVEWVNGECVFYKDKELPIKALSNSHYKETLDIIEKGGPHWWQPDRGQTHKRLALAGKRCADYSPENEPDALKYAFDTLTGYVVAGHTKWNIVYDISKRLICYRSVVSPTVKWLSFENLDFSCSSKLKMLDINAPTEGAVENQFTPYDAEINKKVFQTLCERFELGLSEQDVQGVMTHINSYKCAE